MMRSVSLVTAGNAEMLALVEGLKLRNRRASERLATVQ